MTALRYPCLIFMALLGFLQNMQAQKIKPKPVKVVAQNQFVCDSTFYTMERISLNEFNSILHLNPNCLIQFFQPWCGSSNYWIEDFVPFYNYWESKNIPFYVISDNLYESKYLKITDTTIGKLVHMYNKYHIQFKLYIMTEGEKIEDYQKILSDHYRVKLTASDFGILIKSNRLIYRNTSFKYFKKAKKIWSNHISNR